MAMMWNIAQTFSREQRQLYTYLNTHRHAFSAHIVTSALFLPSLCLHITPVADTTSPGALLDKHHTMVRGAWTTWLPVEGLHLHATPPDSQLTFF